MSQLNLRSKVLHMPGGWGPTVPVAGATVQIIDIDQPGKGDDRIWTGTTDATGRFQGTSAEWQDSVTTRVWVPDWQGGHWENVTTRDVTDVLLLQAYVKQGTRETHLPFVYVNDSVESPPLVVPWGPPPRVIGKVNGAECTSPTELTNKVKAAADSGATPITIEVYGSDAALLNPLTQAQDQLLAWIRQRLNIPADLPVNRAWGGDDVFWVLVGCAIIITAVGVSALLVCIGLALIYAIHKGYVQISVEQCTSAPGGGQNCVKLNLQK